MKLISPIIFIAISGILFFVFIKPIYSETTQLKIDVANYKDAVNNSTDLQKVRDSLVVKYTGITAADKDRLEHFLPSSVNNIGLILEIEKMANLYGMPIKDVKFETKKLQPKDPLNTDNIMIEVDPTENLPYGIFPIEFTVEGNYSSFVSFLTELEHNLRLVDVKSISFSVPTENSSATEKANPDVYSYTLKIETYWFK